MEIIVIAIGTSAATAIIVTKVLATYYFRIIDGYVKSICDKTQESNENTLAIVHRLSQNFDPKE